VHVLGFRPGEGLQISQWDRALGSALSSLTVSDLVSGTVKMRSNHSISGYHPARIGKGSNGRGIGLQRLGQEPLLLADAE